MNYETEDQLLKSAMELQRAGHHAQVVELLLPEMSSDERDIRLTVQLAEAKRRLGANPEAADLYRDAALFYAAEGLLAHAVALERLVASLAPDRSSMLPQIAAAYAKAPAGPNGGAPFGDLFVTVNPGALEMFFSSATLHQLDAKAEIAPDADAPSALFVVLRGEARLFGRGAHGSWVEASRLRAGTLFDTASFKDEAAPRRAIAAFSSTVMEIPWAMVEVLQHRHPAFAESIRSLQRRLSLEGLLANHSAFQSLALRARARLSEAMEEQAFTRGSIIFREGEPADHLYVVEQGRVEVFTQGTEARLELAQLSAGALFGESAAINRAPRTASVRARTDVVVYRIACELLDEILEDQPEALDQLKNSFRSRISDTLSRLDERG